MKSFDKNELNTLEERIKSAFSAEQTLPSPTVKQALQQLLKTRQQKGFWSMLANLVQYSVSAYQPALLIILAGCIGWALKPTVLQPALPATPKIQYVYKTDTLKIPVIQYVHEKQNLQKAAIKRRNTEEIENPISESNSNTNISFPDAGMRLAEAQTGRSLHDDSTYTRLFVSLR